MIMWSMHEQDFDESASILEDEDEATLSAIDRGIQAADKGRAVPLEEVRPRVSQRPTESSAPKNHWLI
jgi:predicted transcriptional regulator